MKQKKESTRNLMLIITGILAFCMITKEGGQNPPPTGTGGAGTTSATSSSHDCTGDDMRLNDGGDCVPCPPSTYRPEGYVGGYTGCFQMGTLTRINSLKQHIAQIHEMMAPGDTDSADIIVRYQDTIDWLESSAQAKEDLAEQALAAAAAPGVGVSADDREAEQAVFTDAMEALTQQEIARVAATLNEVDIPDQPPAGTGGAQGSCGADQYVSSNVCTPCATGTTRPAGDPTPGQDTTCVDILCLAGQHVFSNECRTCPPGKTNEANDPASGINTECDYEPVNCMGNFETCSDNCEDVKYIISQPVAHGGADCDHEAGKIKNCYPGDGDCGVIGPGDGYQCRQETCDQKNKNENTSHNYMVAHKKYEGKSERSPVECYLGPDCLENCCTKKCSEKNSWFDEWWDERDSNCKYCEIDGDCSDNLMRNSCNDGDCEFIPDEIF